MGYTEICSYSFIGPSDYDRIHLPDNSPLRRSAVILNPLGENTSIMRTTLLPSMLEALEINYSRRNAAVSLYEISKIYLPQENSLLADERKMLSLGIYGNNVDFFTIKGDIEALLAHMRVNNIRFEAERGNCSYHPGRCANIMVNGGCIGTFGQIHPLVANEFGIDLPVFAAQIDFELLLAQRSAEAEYTPLPRFPSVTRDIAIVCDQALTAQRVEDCIANAGGELLRKVKLFDVYTGNSIPAGKKSLAFSLTLRADDMTLTVEHAEQVTQNILSALSTQLGAVIR